MTMPCLGHGIRYLNQRTKTSSQRGYGQVLVDLKTGLVGIDAYTPKGIKVDKHDLPETIAPYPQVSIERFDLVPKKNGGFWTERIKLPH